MLVIPQEGDAEHGVIVRKALQRDAAAACRPLRRVLARPSVGQLAEAHERRHDPGSGRPARRRRRLRHARPDVGSARALRRTRASERRQQAIPAGLIMSDVAQQWGADLSAGPTGDLALVDGDALGQQRGPAAAADQPGRLHLAAGLRGRGWRSSSASREAGPRSRPSYADQIFKEPAVARSPEPVIDVEVDPTRRHLRPRQIRRRRHRPHADAFTLTQRVDMRPVIADLQLAWFRTWPRACNPRPRSCSTLTGGVRAARGARGERVDRGCGCSC